MNKLACQQQGYKSGRQHAGAKERKAGHRPEGHLSHCLPLHACLVQLGQRHAPPERPNHHRHQHAGHQRGHMLPEVQICR